MSSNRRSDPHSSTPLDTFRWRGRIVTGENKLITNTLASGLDDYPRAPLPSDQEFHVDLFCWILTSARIMSRLEQVLLSKSPKEGNITSFLTL